MEPSCEYSRPVSSLGYTCLHDHQWTCARPEIEPTVDFLSHNRHPGSQYLLSRRGASQCADRAPASRLSVLIADVGTTVAAARRQISSHRSGLSWVRKQQRALSVRL